MNCKSAKNFFSLRIDGGLSFEEQRRLTEHLESCPACNASFRSFERTVSLVRGLPVVEAPDTFVQDVLLSVRRARAAQAAPPRAGLRERIDGFFERLAWVTSPRIAPAALGLGVLVGLFGAFVVLRPSIGPAPTTADRGAPAYESRLQPGGTTMPQVDESSAQFASGDVDRNEAPSRPLKDLIRELVAREEANPPTPADTAASPDLDWGPSIGSNDVGRQVTAQGPSRSQNRSGRVSIVF